MHYMFTEKGKPSISFSHLPGMFLLYLNSPQNIVITCKVNREWSGCLQHSKSFERLASTKKIWFSLDLLKFRSSSLETRWVKILQNFGEWGSVRPKYFGVIRWNNENSNCSSWLTVKSLGKWQKHYCPDWLCGSSSIGNMTSIKRSGVYPPPSQSTDPPLRVHKDLHQGKDDLHAWSYCPRKSDIS